MLSGEAFRLPVSTRAILLSYGLYEFDDHDVFQVTGLNEKRPVLYIGLV